MYETPSLPRDGDPPGADMKLCFISYARNSNLDGRLAKFVQRLEKMLPAHLPHGTKPEDIIFFDAQSIENSDEWMTRLADASRLCKVCVCFYSVPYFTSEYSGREVQVFLQRVQSWNQVPANAGRQAKAIIPVIWVPFKDEEVPTGPPAVSVEQRQAARQICLRRALRARLAQVPRRRI